MAGARRSARERGKSDPIDAEAVARVALREPDLPKACLDGPSRDIKLLVDHRRTLVAQRTAIGTSCADSCTNSTPSWLWPLVVCAAFASWTSWPTP
jgi:hypothetical protein